MKTIQCVLAGVILFSVTSFTDSPKSDDSLLATWVYDSYVGGTMNYTKEESFNEDKPGIQFKSGGKLVKRQNVGWCGTPPIDYGDNDGTWKQTSDSTITISYHYWGGTAEEDWQIMNVSDKNLTVKQLSYRSGRK